MTTTTTDDQVQCLAILTTLRILHVFQPQPPQVVCDAIMQLSPDTWIVGTNDRGRYKLTLVQNATKAEAWERFESIRGAGTKYIAPRFEFRRGSNPGQS